MCQDVLVIHCHPKASELEGKHKVKLTKKSAYNKIKRKWTKTYHSVGGGYVQGRSSGKILTSNP